MAPSEARNAKADPSTVAPSAKVDALKVPGACVKRSRMALSRDEVHHVALLARLDLTPDEEAAITAQLDHILAHFQELATLDVSGVEPTAHMAEAISAFRDDTVTNPPADESLRANAPARDGDFFKVPKIIE